MPQTELPGAKVAADKPVGAMPKIAVKVNYEGAPGQMLAGAFVFRNPKPVDDQQIAVKVAGFAAPHAVADLDPGDAWWLKCMASITVLCGENVPPWYDVTSESVRKDLPILVYERFLEERSKLFRGSSGNGKGTKVGPTLELTVDLC